MLPREEWLAKAQSMPIGRVWRGLHRREARPNLVIWNKSDSWSCYCHHCHEGGVVMKEHVKFGMDSPEALRSIMTVPDDKVKQSLWDEHMTDRVGRFLASKGMDYLMLPELWFSSTRKRILIQDAMGWMGRDITGNALEKWLTYDRQHYLRRFVGSKTTVLVEDTFSYYKVIWALPHYNVMCLLGSDLRDRQIMPLLNQDKVLVCLDGDKAGHAGASDAVHRLTALGIPAKNRCAPTGYDPKDLTAAELIHLLGDVYDNDAG